MRSLAIALVFCVAISVSMAQQPPDAATTSWWAQTTALANDSMEGRDTGTEAYERAAKYVAAQFRTAGLKPAGDHGTFFQRVPMHQTADLSAADRATFAGRRLHALTGAGVAAILFIDNPAAIEPTYWPAAYARSVQIAPPAPAADAPLVLRISAEAAPKLFHVAEKHSGYYFAELLRDGERGAPLPFFTLDATLHIRIATLEKDISSPNILATLPGSNPALAQEHVALSAHLDGYGYGQPVLGDRLYNGALDDAAYVATLIDLAESFRGKGPARSLLFCIFTGEEKGLLGSVYFTTHPTVPNDSIVADLNLDQLRPIFPLKILTMEGIDDSTLGATTKNLAKSFHIEIRPDREPERNLFRRADNYSFVRIGVPIASFIFGYDPGSPEERIYRDWYARRYHKPQDDLKTPIDWEAAGTFNRFYAHLAATIANDPTRPVWLPSSAYKPKP